MLTAEQVASLFPGARKSSITKNLPIVLAALAEVKLDDAQMVAMALGTIRAETAGFEPISEFRSKWNTIHEPFDVYEPTGRVGPKIGNTEKGDGSKFRGRGFIQLTGRSNFEQIGKLLNVDLVGHPELANDPQIAAKILATFLKNREAQIRKALSKKELATARRLVNGGSHGLEQFSAAYLGAMKILATQET